MAETRWCKGARSSRTARPRAEKTGYLMWQPLRPPARLQGVNPRTPHQIRILTWNIHKGIGGVDRRYDLGRTTAVIESAQPDIALLQEVAQGMPRLRLDDQVNLLATTFGGHAAFH